VLPSYVLGHTSQQDANVVSILSHERPHLSLPSKPLLGGSWILKIFKFKQTLLKLQTIVISGCGYFLKKIQRTGWFPQRTN
jgi:hypothetical protein